MPPRVLGATALILAAVLLLKSGASPSPRQASRTVSAKGYDVPGTKRAIESR